MESGQLEVRLRDFALGPLLQVVQHNFGIIAQSRGLRLDCVGSRYTVRSDEALLRRILQNLLSNAIRYTPGGKVLIGCRRHGDQLRIEVHDQRQLTWYRRMPYIHWVERGPSEEDIWYREIKAYVISYFGGETRWKEK